MVVVRVPVQVKARLQRRPVRAAIALVLLSAHLTGMLLAGFSLGRIGVAMVATTLGFLAVPFCSWELSRLVDWLLQRALRRLALLGATVRVIVGASAIALLPQLYGVLGNAPLPAIGRVVELTAIFVSIGVAAGMILVGLGVADVLTAATAKFRHISTRLMALLLVTSAGSLLWLSFLGAQLEGLLEWAVAQGHLDSYQDALSQIQNLARSYLGVFAGAIGLELPFVLLLAWRFGQNATRGIAELREGFERVGDGDLEEPITVEGNDEIADMQRGFNDMLKSARERRFLETAFGRYVSPAVLERLRGQQGGVATEQRTATVMFTDIRGFTKLSSELSPEEVIALLNRYLSLLIDVVSRHDGYINKFVGDAIVVVWNAPLDQSDHAARAVRCARDMLVELARANAERAFGERTVEMGIGINTGPLVMGNLGNERVVEFAVIGDTVNVASRCCSQAKAKQIVCTPAVLEAAAAHDTQANGGFRSLGPVELKGKGSVELLAAAPLDEAARPDHQATP
ncbi:MAG: adenylate/guanylate cyclase domain-containing protein [Deltaproteobacteria bacterium]|nr:adenylate/guanylate cyclase domain-containing protein [Deltaproteobacteria bacterium]